MIWGRLWYIVSLFFTNENIYEKNRKLTVSDGLVALLEKLSKWRPHM
jgi:hypothetical protein